MTVVIQHQPQFLGRLEWWARMVAADVFILADDVKFERSEGQGREYLDGRLITLPVTSRSGRICETQLRWTPRWRRKMVGTIEQLWKGQPFAKAARESVLAHLPQDFEQTRLLDVVLPMMWHIRLSLGIDGGRILLATDMQHNAIVSSTLSTSAKMAEQCIEAGGTEYWAGRSAGRYMDFKQFRERGIAVVPMRWNGRDAPVLDVVAEVGWTRARTLIGSAEPITRES